MPQEKRIRPAGNGTESADHDGNGPRGNDTRSEAVRYFRYSYAVLVRGKTVRRHLYFNLPAAERAVRRALVRGDDAEMILVRLVPVDARRLDLGVAGDE